MSSQMTESDVAGSVERLLADLEPLTFSARMQRMLELGRAAAAEPPDLSKQQLIEGLGSCGRYGQLLAGQARQQAEAVTLNRQLQDTANAAGAGAAVQLDPALLAMLPETLRVRLAQMHKAGCWAAHLHQLVETLAGQGDKPRLAEALCYGSPTQVEAHWRPVLSWALDKQVEPGPGPSPFLVNTGTVPRSVWRLQCQLWASVAKHHASFIAQQVGGSGSALNLVMRHLSAQCPQEALRLYQGLNKAERARVLDVQRLLEHFPTEVVELALARDKPEAPDAAVGAAAADGPPASSPAELSASSSLVEWEVVSSEGSAQPGAGGSPAVPAAEAAVELSSLSSAAVYELLEQVPVYTGPRFRLRTRYLERMPRDLLLRVLLSGQWGAGDVLARVSVEQRAQLVEDWTAWYAGQHEALHALLAQGEEGRAVQGAVGIAREVEAQAFALWQVQSGRNSLYSIINRLSPDEEEQVLESCMRQAPEFLREEMSAGWLTSRLLDWARWGDLSRVLHAHSRLLLEGGEHVEARLACLMPLLSAQEQVSLYRLRRSQQQEDEAEALKKQEAAAGAQGADALRELHKAEASALLRPLFCAAASDPALGALGGNKADMQTVAASLAAALASELLGEELRSVTQLLHQPRADRLGQNPALNPMTRLLAPAKRGQAKDAVQSAAGILALRLLPEALTQVFEDWESWWQQQVLPRLNILLNHLAPSPSPSSGQPPGSQPYALHDLSDALATACLGRLAPRTSHDELLQRTLAAAARAIRAEVLQRAVEPWLTCPPPPAAPTDPQGSQPAPWLLLPPLQRLRFLRLCLQGAGRAPGDPEAAGAGAGAGAGADPRDWGVEQLTALVLKTLPRVDFKSELCRCSPLTDDEAALLLASPQALEEVLKDGALLTRLPAASRSKLTELHSQKMLDLVLQEPPLIKELPEGAHLVLASLSPTAFTDNVTLLTLLTPKAQVQVLQVYANIRSAKEQALGTLLASTPGHVPSAALSSKLRHELSSADPLAVEGATAGDKLCAPARELLFKACREVWVNEGWDTKAALALLPQPYRTAIARTRAQELAVLARSPGAVKPGLGHKERAVLTWLPWEMVSHPILASMLQNKDAAVRTDALVHLFQAAQQQPSLIPPLLAALHARRREGDPVRQIMLTHLQLLVQARLKVEAAEEEAAAKVEAEALAARPGQAGATASASASGSPAPTTTPTPGLTVGVSAAEPSPPLPALLPAISIIVEDALAAKDLSRGSLSHLSRMLANLLGSPHAAFACSTLAPCARGWGLAALPLDQMSSSIQKRLGVLSQAAKRRAAAAAAPLLRSLPPSDAASLAQLPLGRSARWARVKARAPLTEAEAGEGDGEEAYLMQVVAGSSSLMEAMRQRQDGVQDAIKLLRMLWQVCSAGRTRERFQLRLKPQLMELAHVTVGMLEAASAGAGTAAGAGAKGAAGSGSGSGPGVGTPAAPAAAAPGLAVLAAGEELEFLGKLLLEHAPDTFPRIQRHVFSSPPGSSQTAAHCLSAMRLLDAVPPTRPDLLLTFISANRSMPGVGARALQRLQSKHQEVLRGAVPALFEAEPSLAVLQEVRDQLLNVRQDLLWPLLKGPVLGGMYAEEPPLSPEHVAKEFKRACRICFWLAVPRPTSAQLLTWTPAQQTALADILGKVLRRGTLSLSDSKAIVNLIADLEFVPPTGLLALLQEPGAGAGAGGAGGEDSGAVDEDGKPLVAAAGAEAPGEQKAQLVSEAMRDCVLAALARRLGDSDAVWEALVQASAAGDVNAALAAVSSLHNFNSAGAGAGGVKLEAADVLVRLRSIPWKRAAVTKQVVKLLGKLVPLVPEAFTDLMSIAGSSSMQGVQLQLVGTCIAFLHRPEAKAYVLAAAANHADTDVAMAAAVVPAPPHEPGVLQAVVEVFVALLAHPSPLVRSHAMAAWSTASTPVPLAVGLPVATAMLAIARQPKASTAEQAEARRHASAWFMSVG